MPKELFRTRLDTPLDRKALNFISSLKEDLWIAEIDILGTEVHDIMLFEQNLLNKSEIKFKAFLSSGVSNLVLNNSLGMINLKNCVLNYEYIYFTLFNVFYI